MLHTAERYTPTADAGAELLQLAFENLLRGHADPEDTIEAIDTAFLGVQSYGVVQGEEGGWLSKDAIAIS